MFVSKRLLEKRDQEIAALKDLIKSGNEALQRLSAAESRLKEEFELKEKKAVAALEARLEKEKLELERKYMRSEQEFTKKHLEENFDKLSTSLQKLHEEGNVTTKYIHELSLKLADGLSSGKKQVKYESESK